MIVEFSDVRFANGEISDVECADVKFEGKKMAAVPFLTLFMPVDTVSKIISDYYQSAAVHEAYMALQLEYHLTYEIWEPAGRFWSIKFRHSTSDVYPSIWNWRHLSDDVNRFIFAVDIEHKTYRKTGIRVPKRCF